MHRDVWSRSHHAARINTALSICSAPQLPHSHHAFPCRHCLAPAGVFPLHFYELLSLLGNTPYKTITGELTHKRLISERRCLWWQRWGEFSGDFTFWTNKMDLYFKTSFYRTHTSPVFLATPMQALPLNSLLKILDHRRDTCWTPERPPISFSCFHSIPRGDREAG